MTGRSDDEKASSRVTGKLTLVSKHPLVSSASAMHAAEHKTEGDAEDDAEDSEAHEESHKEGLEVRGRDERALCCHEAFTMVTA